MKFLYTTVIVALFVSCTNNDSKPLKVNHPILSNYSCYVYALNKDSIKLQLKDSNSIMSGYLDYLPYEKDGSVGILYNIHSKGDTLFAMYKYTQEGVENICEFALLKKESAYLLTDDIWGSENYKYDSTNTKGSFIDKYKISFSSDTLKKVDCK